MTSRLKYRILDYKIFSETGRKVFKVGREAEMERLIIEELKIVEDIHHTLNLYERWGCNGF